LSFIIIIVIKLYKART